MEKPLVMTYRVPQIEGKIERVRRGILYTFYGKSVNCADACKIANCVIAMYIIGNREENLTFSEGRIEVRSITDVLFRGSYVMQTFRAKMSAKSIDSELEIVVTETIDEQLN